MNDRDFESMAEEVVALRDARRELQAERDRLYLAVNNLRNELNARDLKIRELNATLAELMSASHDLHQ